MKIWLASWKYTLHPCEEPTSLPWEVLVMISIYVFMFPPNCLTCLLVFSLGNKQLPQLFCRGVLKQHCIIRLKVTRVETWAVNYHRSCNFQSYPIQYRIFLKSFYSDWLLVRLGASKISQSVLGTLQLECLGTRSGITSLCSCSSTAMPSVFSFLLPQVSSLLCLKAYSSEMELSFISWMFHF